MSQAVRLYLYLLALEAQDRDHLIFFYAADDDEASDRASDYEADHHAKRSELRQFKRGLRVVEFEMPAPIDVEETPF